MEIAESDKFKITIFRYITANRKLTSYISVDFSVLSQRKVMLL